MTEHEIEPVPGLPESLPQGEAIVWQGKPDWRLLARHAFHIRLIALYFAALVLAGLVAGATRGATITLVLGVVAIGLIALFAWAVGRSTLYTVTDRRIVMRFGVALPMCVNLPMGIVETARVNVHKDGSADLCLALKPGHRAGFFLLWPHTRPWKLGRPEPMLRALPDGQRVAALLARTMAQAVPGGRLVRPVEADTPSLAPSTQPVAA